MSEPNNKKALETGSGIAWSEWLEFLEPHSKLNHTEMAKIVLEKINFKGKSKSPEWWAQGVTIAYEKQIGRRQTGQQADGNFSVTVSKTLDGDMDEVLEKWLSRVESLTEFNGVKISGKSRISQTEKWRYWRCDLADGSRLSVNIQSKPSGNKSALAINHDKLSRPQDVEIWRSFWKSFLNDDRLL